VIRVIVFICVVALVASGAAWFVDRPGEIVLTWQNWRISTSLMVAIVIFAASIVAAIFIWTLIRVMVKLPDLVSLFFRERRRAKGWRAITQGMIAIGAGNLTLARRSASEARKFVGHEPLTLLLAAQTAQLGGDIEKAETEFRLMLLHSETKLLGLRGLYVEAIRRNDAASARAYAEESMQGDPVSVWAAEAFMEFQCRAGDWNGALKTLERAVDASAMDKAMAKRHRAVLLTAQALSIEETNPGEARELALEAVKLTPDLVPAAALAGRLLGIAGRLRKAAGIVEKAWVAIPHPDLAEVYANLQPGDSAKDRLKRVKKLVRKTKDNFESRLAVARSAMDANHFDEARAALVPLLGDPTQRACLLMAEIEASEHGDHGKAREWTVRALRGKRDPAWIADGYVSERWLPASPHTGRLDAFEWLIPPTASMGLVLEQAAEQAFLAASPVSVPAAKAEPQMKTVPVLDVPKARAPKRPEAVAPFVAEPPLPDDPGPEIDEKLPPRWRFRFFDWLAGPTA
jgi:HemY protein